VQKQYTTWKLHRSHDQLPENGHHQLDALHPLLS